MSNSISSSVRLVFLAQSIISAILGLSLWVVPGRTLIDLLRWETSPGERSADPILSRLLGAALLVLAFVSYRARSVEDWRQVTLLVQLLVLFCVLGVVATVGVLVFLAPPELRLFQPGWALAVILAIFAVVWGIVWRANN